MREGFRSSSHRERAIVTAEAAEMLRQQAWSIYAKHLHVLHAALRGAGRLGILEGMDLVHDFVLERLPRALASYNPQVGPIEPWLFAVFRRYLNRCLREEAAARRGWLSLEPWEDSIPAKADTAEVLSPARLDRVREALRKLPDELRSVLLAYFGRGPGSGNERALSRMLHLSRYTVRQRLLTAMNDLAAQLEGEDFFSQEELRACRDCLVERKGRDDIAAELGKTREEVESLVRNVLTTLGAALTQAIAAPVVFHRSMAMENGRVKYEQLVRAVNAGNAAELEALRADWQEITQFVREHPQEADRALLPDERRPVLILWLSTPPSPEPIPWADLTGEPSFVLDERRERLALVGQLWNAWLDNGIRGSLERVLAEARFERRHDWCRNVDALVDRAHSVLAGRAFADEDVRLDVVAGYGAAVDQVLLQRGGARTEASLDVLGFESPPALLLPDRTRVSCEALGRAIAFRCGRLGDGREPAAADSFGLLAAMVSLSLPAHPDVLPLVDVRLNSRHCQLVSGRGDALADFLRE
jgi:RNA polymerase sigma factor (sigma-70 family)